MSQRKFALIDRAQHCVRTYATLRIYPQHINSASVDEFMGIKATKIWSQADGKPFDGWFLTTRGEIDSNDTTEHIQYLLDIVRPKRKHIVDVIAGGGTVNIINFWHSDGQGGPGLSSHIISQMAELSIEVDWNVYMG
ncbi:uncharacterized protein DUF4279 [Sinobacterium caligoides]|uniref:Uncharacterized protein DUF4279 n=1 Tax=Sinobacterium caligoides TaxID=933926 RepID=A0A3N2DXK3_9GAMM|nr:DUF4279 domain-containing protein [Sinobacterium caligoides]ROS04551.1 uncharacterized protein DUF4279 [Sinobacterium caligoides]